MMLFIAADACLRIVQLILLNKVLKFDSWCYAREAYLKPVAIAIVMGLLIYGYSLFKVESVVLRLMAIVACSIITTFLVFFYGLTSGERTKILSQIRNKLRYCKVC